MQRVLLIGPTLYEIPYSSKSKVLKSPLKRRLRLYKQLWNDMGASCSNLLLQTRRPVLCGRQGSTHCGRWSHQRKVVEHGPPTFGSFFFVLPSCFCYRLVIVYWSWELSVKIVSQHPSYLNWSRRRKGILPNRGSKLVWLAMLETVIIFTSSSLFLSN